MTRLRLAAALTIICAGLIAFDGWLARLAARDLRQTALSSFAKGSLLMAQGKPEQALDPLREAWMLARENPQYQLQLGNALAAAKRLDEAGLMIGEALSREPDDGEANLAMARYRARTGDAVGANSFYHRAVYGNWGAGAAARRVVVRMELIAALAAEGRREEMIAELIAVEESDGVDDGTRKMIAKYFLQAGSTTRAAAVYESLLRTHPADKETRARLQLVDTVMKLDPTVRQLSASGKYLRSLHFLELTQAAVERAVAAIPGRESGGLNAQLAGTLAETREALAQRARGLPNYDDSEELIAMALRLWRSRVESLGPDASPEDEALRLVMDRL